MLSSVHWRLDSVMRHVCAMEKTSADGWHATRCLASGGLLPVVPSPRRSSPISAPGVVEKICSNRWIKLQRVVLLRARGAKLSGKKLPLLRWCSTAKYKGGRYYNYCCRVKCRQRQVGQQVTMIVFLASPRSTRQQTNKQPDNTEWT